MKRQVPNEVPNEAGPAEPLAVSPARPKRVAKRVAGSGHGLGHIPYPSPRTIAEYAKTCPVPYLLNHPQSAGNRFKLLPGLPIAAIAAGLGAHVSSVSRALMTGNVTLDKADRVMGALTEAGIKLEFEQFAGLVEWLKNHPVSLYYRRTGRSSPAMEKDKKVMRRVMNNPAWKGC